MLLTVAAIALAGHRLTLDTVITRYSTFELLPAFIAHWWFRSTLPRARPRETPTWFHQPLLLLPSRRRIESNIRVHLTSR
jgi:hypothetical protein